MLLFRSFCSKQWTSNYSYICRKLSRQDSWKAENCTNRLFHCGDSTAAVSVPWPCSLPTIPLGLLCASAVNSGQFGRWQRSAGLDLGQWPWRTKRHNDDIITATRSGRRRPVRRCRLGFFRLGHDSHRHLASTTPTWLPDLVHCASI